MSDAPPRYPRDMIGYGPDRPDPRWPGGGRIAVQIVLNYEEGAENNLLHGDAASEAFLSEIPGAQPWPGQRHWNMESIYEYGARVGFWRLHRLLGDLPITVYGVAEALARSPEQVAAMQSAGWEIASHGLKWIEHKDMPAEEEAAQIDQAIALHTEVTGAPPRGWYTGRCSMNTVRLAAETGQFAYLSDIYDDDLPYWRPISGRNQLMIPYTLDCNDMRFSTTSGFATGRDFHDYLCDTFDALYAEGGAMMSVGLHCRLVGRPGRLRELSRFLDHVRGHDDVWFARRIDIAEHWAQTHPPQDRPRPSLMSKAEFVAAFGAIYEHSAWIAEDTWDRELGPAHDRAEGLWNAMARIFRSAPDARRLSVLNAHPDLAGKLASAKRLTADSTAEQASAGLDALTDPERATFTRLNADYTKRHGFPFIICVRDYTKTQIVTAFERRLNNDRAAELAEACHQVERIAWHRLKAILP
ncbi:MAG: allantoinase PuuE [Pseudomonadota bacterium]